jgi:uncharacterized phage protein gp47/JayE
LIWPFTIHGKTARSLGIDLHKKLLLVKHSLQWDILRLKTEASVLKYRFAYMGGIMEFFTIGKRFWQINLGKCFPSTKEKLCSNKGYTAKV